MALAISANRAKVKFHARHNVFVLNMATVLYQLIYHSLEVPTVCLNWIVHYEHVQGLSIGASVYIE